MDFEVVQGDIAEQKADGLVNAAGTSLRMGSGVAGALRRGAEGPINQEAMRKGPIDLGEVAVTGAYELDAEYVIHAAAMPHHGDGKATKESIKDAARNALEKADQLGCQSVVIPALGCGVAGFPIKKGGTDHHPRNTEIRARKPRRHKTDSLQRRRILRAKTSRRITHSTTDEAITQNLN